MAKRILLLFLFFQLVVLAQSDNRIIWYTERDGLPSPLVEDLEIDQYGNLLLSNHLGLTIFNGKKFTTKTQGDGLANSSVGSLLKDPFQRVWIFSYSRKLTVFENNQFKQIAHFNATYSRWSGLYELYFVNRKEFILDYMMPFRSLHYKYVKGVWKLIKKHETTENKLYFRSPNDRKRITCEISTIPDNDTVKMRFHFTKNKKDEFLYFMTEGNYYAKLNTEHHTYFCIGNYFLELGDRGFLKKVQLDGVIRWIQRGAGNYVWIKTMDETLLKFDLQKLKVTFRISLKGKGLNTVKEDINGNLWFGADSGLGFFKNIHLKRYLKNEELISGVNTTIVLKDTIFIGHTNGDIGYFIPGKMKHERLLFKNDKIPSYKVNCVSDFEVFDNYIYAINRWHGSYRIDRKSLKVSMYSVQNAYSLAKNNEGTKLYAASYENGITEIRKDTCKSIALMDKNKEPVGVTCLLPLSDNRFYLGNSEKLFGWSAGKLIPSFSSPFLNERVIAIKALGGGYLFGTYGNGLVFAREKDTMNISTLQGLSSDFINALHIEKNKVWVATSNGVNLVLFNERFSSYKVYRLLGKYCLNNDIFEIVKYKDKMVLVSNSAVGGGLEFISEHRLTKKSRLNKLRLERSLINGQETEKNSGFSFIYSKDSNLEFKPSIANYEDEEIVYYYRLKGYHKNWYSTKSSFVQFKGLPPDDYELEMYASPEFFSGKSNLVSVNFSVIPLWYQDTKTLVPLIILFCIVFGLALLSYIQRKRSEYRAKLEIASLEANVIRAQMNPHFLFNSINSIQGFIISKQNDQANYYLSRFSNLLRQIIDLSSKKFCTLAEELNVLENYVKIEQVRCNHSFSYQVTVDEKIRPDKIVFPSMLLQPFVENSIVHGLIPLENREGFLELTISQDSNSIRVTIKDNGIGRENALMNKKKRQQYHQVSSTSLNNYRMKVYEKLMGAKAEISIEDLKDTDGSPIGTKVVLICPYMSK